MEEDMIQVPQESPMESEMVQGQVKVILLRQRKEYLLGKVTELDEEPSLLIENCYRIEVNEKGLVVLHQFPSYSAQRDMFLTSDVVLSILDPSEEVLQIYNAE